MNRAKECQGPRTDLRVLEMNQLRGEHKYEVLGGFVHIQKDAKNKRREAGVI